MVSLTKQRNEKTEWRGRRKGKLGKEHLSAFFPPPFPLPFDLSIHGYIVSFGRVGNICRRKQDIREIIRDRWRIEEIFTLSSQTKRLKYIQVSSAKVSATDFTKTFRFHSEKNLPTFGSANKTTRFRMNSVEHPGNRLRFEYSCLSNIQCRCTKRVRRNVSFPYNVTSEEHIFPDKSDR